MKQRILYLILLLILIGLTYHSAFTDTVVINGDSNCSGSGCNSIVANLSAPVNTGAAYNSTLISLQNLNTEFQLAEQYDAAILGTSNLIGFWILNGVPTDYSSSGANATLYGGTTYSCKLFVGATNSLNYNLTSQSLLANGIDSYGLANNSFGDVDFKTQAFTIETLVRFPAIDTYQTFGGIKPTTGTNFGVQFTKTGVGQNNIVLVFLRADGTTTGRVTVRGTTTSLVASTAYHIVITYDGTGTPSDTTVTITINNVVQALSTVTVGSSTWGSTNNKVNIGSLELLSDTYPCLISRLAIYNAVLTGTVITNHYNALSYASNSPTITSAWLVDSTKASTSWDFSNDSITVNPRGESADVKFKWSVDDGVRNWSAAWTTLGAYYATSNQIGRYKAVSVQMNSDGSNKAVVGSSKFRATIQ